MRRIFLLAWCFFRGLPPWPPLNASFIGGSIVRAFPRTPSSRFGRPMKAVRGEVPLPCADSRRSPGRRAEGRRAPVRDQNVWFWLRGEVRGGCGASRADGDEHLRVVVRLCGAGRLQAAVSKIPDGLAGRHDANETERRHVDCESQGGGLSVDMPGVRRDDRRMGSKGGGCNSGGRA